MSSGATSLSASEWSALGRYVRAIADAMELRDWTLNVEHRPSDDRAVATIFATYGRKVAHIYFCENFRNLRPEEQRHAVVHELVHCHLESAASMVRCDLEAHLGKQTDQIFWEGFKRQIEYGVDALAVAFAKHMPLIDWPKKTAQQLEEATAST